MAFTGIHHLVIRVHDLEASIKQWRDTLGMPLSRTQSNESLGVHQAIFDLPGGGFIELVAPTDDQSPVAKALASRGEGVHLVSMSVQNVDDTVEQLAANNVVTLGEPGGPRFVHPKAASGVMLGLTQTEAQ